MRKNSGACYQKSKIVLEMNARRCSLSEIARAIGTNKRHVKRFLRERGERRAFLSSKSGERHYNWRGGKLVDKDGYRLIYAPNHPSARKWSPYILEHRLVMENKIGRALLRGEVVHHKNKNKLDNRIENLELFSKNSDHLRHELKGQVPKWSADGKRRLSRSRNLTGNLRRGKSPDKWRKQNGEPVRKS